MRLGYRDERIVKRTNGISAKLYPVIMALTIIMAVAKYFLVTQNVEDYILEMVAIVGSLGYLLIRSIITQIPVIGYSDECIQELQNSYRAHSFNICFFLYVFGEFILFFIFDKLEVATLYIPIWSIPAFIYTVYSIKNGLFIWGSKKKQVNNIKSFKRNTIIGSLFYGTVVGGNHLFDNGKFNPMGIVTIIMLALMWGIPFYFIMKVLIKESEKCANDELKNS